MLAEQLAEPPHRRPAHRTGRLAPRLERGHRLGDGVGDVAGRSDRPERPAGDRRAGRLVAVGDRRPARVEDAIDVGAQRLGRGNAHDTDSHASARIARAASACSIVTTSGGAMRIARSPHVNTSSPRSKHASLECLGGVVVGRVDADHQPAAAHVGDHRVLRLHRTESGEEVGADRRRVGRQSAFDRDRTWRPRRRRRPGCPRTSSRAARVASP